MKTTKYTLESMDALYPKECVKFRELLNKTISQYLKERTKNVDCLVAHFLMKTKCNPSYVVIVEKETEFGREISVKHKNTPYQKHFNTQSFTKNKKQ